MGFLADLYGNIQLVNMCLSFYYGLWYTYNELATGGCRPTKHNYEDPHCRISIVFIYILYIAHFYIMPT